MIKIAFTSAILLTCLAQFRKQPEEGEFKIHIILHSEAPALNYYRYDETWKRFISNYKHSTHFISDHDIKEYNWVLQQITLTQQGVDKLSLLLKDKIYDQNTRFIVSLKNKNLYGGSFLYSMSAMGINYPVMYRERIEKINHHPTFVSDSSILTIRPYQGSVFSPSTNNKLVANEKIRKYFQAIGKLK